MHFPLLNLTNALGLALGATLAFMLLVRLGVRLVALITPVVE